MALIIGADLFWGWVVFVVFLGMELPLVMRGASEQIVAIVWRGIYGSCRLIIGKLKT